MEDYARLARGQQVVITRKNKPVALVVGLRKTWKITPRFGGCHAFAAHQNLVENTYQDGPRKHATLAEIGKLLFKQS